MLEKRIFTKGMDFSDTEQRLVEQGYYRYGLNIRALSSDQDAIGAIENTRGNTLITYILPSGTNKVVGAYDNKTTNKVYYFVYNSLSNHLILEYDANANIVNKVLQNSLLAFNPSFLITGVNVIEGLLYWTDDNKEPRKINIDKAKSNQYPSPFLEDFIYAIKQPPLCQPDVAYNDDQTRNVNYLEQKLFQFKYRWIYDDKEKSVWSPISVVPIPVLTCGTSLPAGFNNNIRVIVETGSGIIVRIEIAAREGNVGDFFSIVDLDKSVLGIANNTTYTYSFYNDKNYNNIDINRGNQLFDAVPLKSKAQENIGNRLGYGNILEGFDPVVPNATLVLDFKAQPLIQLFNIRGRIRIMNPYINPGLGNANFCAKQPIYDLGEGAGTQWGGFYLSGAGIPLIVNGAGSSYGQTLPLNGFLAYLAGTPYYGVSKQIAPSGSDPLPTLMPNNTGVYDANGTQFSNTYPCGNANVGRRKAICCQIVNQDVYSEYTIENVPVGTYVLRFASHLTTQDDLDSGNINWQKRSTNMVAVGGANDTECTIVVSVAGITVNGGPLIAHGSIIGDSAVVDLTDPRLFGIATAVTGYLVDIDNTSLPADQMINDTRIEYASMAFSQTGINWGVGLALLIVALPYGVAAIAAGNLVLNWQAGNAYTDHNGYFFFTKQDNIGGNLDVTSPVNSNNINVPITKTDLSGGAWTPPNTNEMKMVLCRVQTPGDTSNCRTLLKGNLSYNNIGFQGASVVVTHSRVDITDVNGDFDIYVYGALNTGAFTGSGVLAAGQRKDYVIYGLTDNCIATFSPASDYFAITINNAGSNQTMFVSPYSPAFGYNQGNGFTVVDAIITALLGAGSENAEKRGADIQYGIVYYDHANRSGTTNTNDAQVDLTVIGSPGLKLHIPFYTEINPTSGTIYGSAEPFVKWSIYHQPPIWATHYQWVKTKNSAINRYLQFSAKTIDYVDDQRIPVGSFTAGTKVGIGLYGIGDYNTMHTDSVLSYGYTKGDRIRLIKTKDGFFFNEYIDLAIRDYDPAGIAYIDNVVSIGEIFPGTLFEIYTPKLKVDTEIYYEFGQCWEIGNPGTSTRYHKGGDSTAALTATDQSTTFIGGVSTVAATGVFTSGDAYYRLRNIPYGTATTIAGTKLWFIEDANFNDFFISNYYSIGRPNRVEKDFKQVRRPTTVFWTGKFIPETNINDLNNVFDIDFQTYERRYGSIQKLFTEDQRLLLFQELKVGQAPIEQIIYNNLEGGNTVGASPVILSKQVIYYQGEYGIGLNPESFAVYAKRKYFIDVNRGAALRLSIDGLTAISDYRMFNYFANKCGRIVNAPSGFRVNIYGTYDVSFGEYIVAFENPIPDSSETPFMEPSETLAFNERGNAWTTFYSYLPEFMSSQGTGIVTFRDGKIYIHNDSNTYNNFYGVQYNSEIHVVSNTEPGKVKVFESITEDTLSAWEAYSIVTPEGQESDLQTTDFEDKENVKYAAVLFDKNTPNVVNPIIEGDPMRSTTALFKLRNSDTTYVRLFKVNVNWIGSERSDK